MILSLSDSKQGRPSAIYLQVKNIVFSDDDNSSLLLFLLTDRLVMSFYAYSVCVCVYCLCVDIVAYLPSCNTMSFKFTS